MSAAKGATPDAQTTTTAAGAAPKPLPPPPPPPPSKVYGRIVLSLRNQLLPEDKLRVTPSQSDGLDFETETDLRIYGCELIQTAGILLKLPQVAMATGQVLLQRFYYSKSLVRHPVDQTAMACVCLASKIEEAPRRVRDVINVFGHIRQVNSNKPIQPVVLDQNYIQLKNQVIKAERRVLKELGFCVHIKHPHKIIVMYLQVLGYEKHQNLMQYSWNYMNDSLRTDVFVRYQPESIACACIYLTARKLRIPLPKNPAWYQLFGVSESEIRDICVRILKLYNRNKPDIDDLEHKADELRKRYQEAKQKARSSSSSANNGNNGLGNNHGSSSHHNNNSNSADGPPGGGASSNGTAGAGGGSPAASPAHRGGGGGAGAHNAWGGFISRSGSHVAPPSTRSPSRSPPPAAGRRAGARRHERRRCRTRSRSPVGKKGGGGKSSSRKGGSNREKKRSPSNDRENKYDRHKDDKDKSSSHKRDKYDARDEKPAPPPPSSKGSSDDRYNSERDSRYKKSKHRSGGGGGGDEERDRERSKDRRR